MASKALAETPTRESYDDWVRLGSLDAIAPVPQALRAFGDARQATLDARAAEDALLATERSGAPRERRSAHARLMKAREDLEDCAIREDEATRALHLARQAAYARVAPPINTEHQRRLPALEAALRVALAAARDVQEVEVASGAFSLPHAGGIAPAKSPVAGRVTEFVLFELNRCLDTLDRIRQRSAA
jgi:hypothetical protein